MSNRANEQNMVDNVRETYASLVVSSESSNKVSGPTSKCDIAIMFKGVTYYLEAKHYDKSNEANYPKQLMTECLINRKLHGETNSFGILVDCDQNKNSKILSYIKEHIGKEDWILFGKTFNCRAIFLYNGELYFQQWDNLYEKPSTLEQIASK